jgi:hypothetical protein
MDEIAIREPRGHGDEAMKRVLCAETLLMRWRSVPMVDPAAFRDDLDAALGLTLVSVPVPD